jgi:hypothetical protein
MNDPAFPKTCGVIHGELEYKFSLPRDKVSRGGVIFDQYAGRVEELQTENLTVNCSGKIPLDLKGFSFANLYRKLRFQSAHLVFLDGKEYNGGVLGVRLQHVHA